MKKRITRPSAEIETAIRTPFTDAFKTIRGRVCEWDLNKYNRAANWTAMAFAKRLLEKTLLGIHKQGDHLHFRPHLPKSWDSYNLHYRYHQTVYHLTFTREPDAPPPEPLHLQNDRQEHHLEIKVGVPH